MDQIYSMTDQSIHPEIKHIGGKAFNLCQLRDLKMNVPAFYIIPADQFEVDSNPSLWADLSKQALQSGLFKNENARFAVRSSGVAEDGQEHSFAGQFDTLLNVTTEGLADAIKEVHSSAQSERVLHYRKKRNIKGSNSISIIIQKMIDPAVAGVAFGMHPVSGNTKEKVISTVFGLGEGLVSGKYNADTFVVDEQKNIKSEIALKKAELVFDSKAGYGNIEKSIPIERQQSASLSETQILDIVVVLDELQQHFKYPQDIEFGIENGELFLLQTRPITTIAKTETVQNKGDFIIWDNSNIVESYPGYSLPLGFSFIRKMYEAVYIQFTSIMGVSRKEMEDNSNIFKNMLGLLRGRVYYNLLSWYRILALLPGYAINAEFMEKMMGVKQRFELKDLPVRSKFAERLRVLNMVKIMLLNLWRLPKMTKRFQKEFNQVMVKYNAINLSEKNSWELMRLYKDYEHTLLKKWKAPLVNDFYAMIYFGVLQKLVTKYNIDKTATLHNNLLCGGRDIISTEPVNRCLTLSESIQSDPATKKIFIDNSAQNLYEKYRAEAFPIDIQNQISAYIQKWGDRCVGELKLETITYKQNPVVFLEIIKTYVEQGIRKKDNNIDLQIREEAEAVVAQKLKGKWLKKLLFNWVLKRTRRLVSNRENLRFERTRGFGVVRAIFSAIGVRFADLKIIETPSDIHYLTQEEIFDYVQGTSLHAKYHELVALRKNEYQKFASEPKPAERVRTDGVVYAVNDLTLHCQSEESDKTSEENNKETLQGLGSCPGIIRKKVRIIHDPKEIRTLHGDILVTTSTDPGWVTLFPTASGILVEKGSLLSHSAIVSREMGIPCIVAIDNLLEKLQSGDLVEMNGSTGKVSIIQRISK